MGHEVFISHASQDKPTALAISDALTKGGVTSWLAVTAIKPGGVWAGDIASAIDASRVMVVVISSHAGSSPHVIREVERAANRGLTLIPFRIEDAPLPGGLEYFLQISQRLDAFEGPLEKHLARLVEAVRHQGGEAEEVGGRHAPPSRSKGRRRALYAAAAAAALVVLLAAGVGLKSCAVPPGRHNRAGATPEPSPAPRETPPPASKGRAMTYSFVVQKYRNGRPAGEPFTSKGDTVFEKNDRVKIRFSSAQPGHFYFLHEEAGGAGARAGLRILFPEEDAAALLRADETLTIPTPSADPAEDWIEFYGTAGTERVWMVWSESRVEVLEAVRQWGNRRHEGRIKDSAQREAVRAFLDSHHRPGPGVKKSEEGTTTTLSAEGDILVYALDLTHV